ncbi:MAG: dicarboxylate/amino acid:cation symporter [Lentisphaerota bacterium]
MAKQGGSKSNSNQILIAMGLAIVIGLIINYFGHKYNFIAQYKMVEKYSIGPIGEAFLKLLLMGVLPIVFLAIVGGIVELGQDKGKLKRVSLKAGLYFFFTTLAALVIGLCVAFIINPGKVGNMGEGLDLSKGVASMNIMDVFLNMFPKNPFASFAEANMLQIIFFAIFLGVAIVMVGGERMKKVNEVFHYIMEIMIEIIKMVMKVAPIGVFCLLLKVTATQGLSTILGLLLYIVAILIGLVLQFIIVYCPVLYVTTGLKPLKFLAKFKDIAVVAFATSSSKATLPFAMEVCEEKFGVEKDFCRFILPLGASVNMNGSAIMQSVAVIFIAQIYHVELSAPMLCAILFTAVFTSAGAAGIPSGATITLTTILLMVGIPAEGIALILGVDRIVDMCRTVVNVSGDVVCTISIAGSEKAINKQVLLS